MEYEIERSFLDWTIEEVVKWLQTLSLSQDYSSHFKDHSITGSLLIKLNPAALDELGITEGGDRVKILQQLTTMRADLIPSRAISPVKRVHSPTAAKLRRYSEISRPGHNRLHGRLMRQTLSSSTLERSLPAPIQPTKLSTTPIREASPPDKTQQEGSGINPSSSNHSSRSRLSSMEHTSSDSLESCWISSPTKSRGSSSPHYGLEGGSSKEKGMESYGGGEDGEGGEIQRDATFRSYTNNMRRLSRSLDGLFLDGEDSSLVSEPVDHRESSCSGNSRLVEILREENTTLKKELESYYNRVRKLQKLEREMERIREAHRLLEASASRRAKLEATMRDKLEQEIRKLKEDNIQQKAELKSSRKDSTSGSDTAKGKSREIRRRDTMIMKLIKKNKDAAAVREQLEKDLEAAKAQLMARRTSETAEQGEQEATKGGGKKSSTEIETNIALMYSESIEKLKGVLQAMQYASQKRENLEKQLREQLQSEIDQLKGGTGASASAGKATLKQRATPSELQQQILQLEAEVAKWEHKCLELVAEKQMALETAVVPRDTRLAHLERSLAEKTDILHELRQQRSMYLSQISDANQKLAEMETKVTSLRSTIQEKDSLVQMLQQSFLDPDDYSSTCGSFSQDDQILTSLHHSPVSAKKFNLNGTVGIGGRRGGNDTSPYNQLSLQIPPPPLPSYHQQRFTNGAHAHASGRNPRYLESSSPRGYPGELGSPIKGYSNYSVPTSPVKTVQYERSGSLSPVKRPNESWSTAKYYNLELSSDDAMADGASHPPPYRGHAQLPVASASGGLGNGYNGNPAASTSHHYHKLSVPTSNSAPNSPSVRKVIQKPRISQPNIHHIQHAPPMPGGGGGSATAVTRANGEREQNLSCFTRLGSPPKYRNPKVVKSNTGDMKRNHIRAPINMDVKSKTPPPNYKLEINHRQPAQTGGGQSSTKGVGGVSVNGSHHHGNGYHGHLRPPADHQKQCYRSMDDFLGNHHGEKTTERAQDGGLFDAAVTNSSLQLSTNSNNSSSLALFESLIGDSLPKTSSPLIGSSVSSRRCHNNMNSATHRHSQSSPTRELVHL